MQKLLLLPDFASIEDRERGVHEVVAPASRRQFFAA
jgi:hypothetical protein